MLVFADHQSGIIEIPRDDWAELMQSDQLASDLQVLRATIARDYDFSRKEFQRSKEALYEAQM